MKKIATLMVLVTVSISCSLLSSTQIEPTRTADTPPKPTGITPTPIDEINLIPVYWDSPDEEIAGTNVSTAALGKYLAVYLEPPDESDAISQFLLLETNTLSSEQVVGLRRELTLTQIDQLDILTRRWEAVGRLSASDTIADFKAAFGESDLVIFGIQDPSTVDDLSGFAMTIYDSPFDLVKYALLEDWGETSANNHSENMFASDRILTIYLTAVYVPWGILGNLLEYVQEPTPLKELFLKFMCGPELPQEEPCESVEIKEEYQRQHTLLQPMSFEEETELQLTAE